MQGHVNSEASRLTMLAADTLRVRQMSAVEE